MGRHYEVRWHAATESWRSDCGDLYVDKKGRQRRKTMTFRYPDGRKIPKSDKGAAMAALARRLDQLRPIDVGGYTVFQVVEFFLQRFEQRVENDLAAQRTYGEYTKLLSRAVEAFGKNTPASQIKAADLQALVESWVEQGKKPSYINALIASAGSCFSWASRPIKNRGKDFQDHDLPEQLIPANPFVKFPKLTVPRTPVKYANRSEIALILRWMWNRAHPERIEGPFTVGPVTGLRHGPERRQRPRDHWRRQLVLLVRTILWTGCRPSEACRSLWEWVDWEARTITIPPNRWKNGRKTGKSRRIYLPPNILRAMRRIHDGPVRHPEHIFAHRHGRDGVEEGANATTGKPWNAEYLCLRMKQVRDAAIKAGVPLKREGDNRWHLYRLRHTRASDGLMRGLSEAQIGEVLGTSADQITRTYGHFLDGKTAEAARTMFGRQPPSSP